MYIAWLSFSLPFCEGTASGISFGQPMLHDVSLVDVQTSSLPERFPASAITANELASGNSYIFLTLGTMPRSRRHSIQESQVDSLASLASPECSNLVHASLCAHVELVTPIRHTKKDSVLSSRWTLAVPFVTPRIMKRIFSAKCGSARANLRSLHSS